MLLPEFIGKVKGMKIVLKIAFFFPPKSIYKEVHCSESSWSPNKVKVDI